MRKDMAKVLVERSRLGGKNDRKGRAPKSLEDLPRKQSMKRAHKDRKSLNENLSPLNRYLHSAVGRQWNLVFSDICKSLRLQSAVQKHVRDHVFDFVHLDVEKDGTSVFARIPYSGSRLELNNNELYVDPTTNLLCAYRRPKRETLVHPRIPPAIEIDVNQLLHVCRSRVEATESGALYKVTKASNGGVASRQRATAALARVDARSIADSVAHGDIRTFLQKPLPTSEYVRVLVMELNRLLLHKKISA